MTRQELAQALHDFFKSQGKQPTEIWINPKDRKGLDGLELVQEGEWDVLQYRSIPVYIDANQAPGQYLVK